ncbi:hypothetical protein MASR2M78_10160 [Treponema sp.]
MRPAIFQSLQALSAPFRGKAQDGCHAGARAAADSLKALIGRLKLCMYLLRADQAEAVFKAYDPRHGKGRTLPPD